MPRMRKEQIDRRKRMAFVLDYLKTRSQFSSEDLIPLNRSSSRGFVQRILKQLHADGLLFLSEDMDGCRYRWIEDHRTIDVEDWIDRQVMGTQLTSTPEEERPRERLLRIGAEKLRTAELLAILIRSGRPGESALQAGEKVANRLQQDLDRLRQLSPTELKSWSSALSSTAYCQIMAGIELGRRVTESLAKKGVVPPRIDSTTKAIEYCKIQFARLALDRTQEEFHIVTLDTKLQPIGHHQITVGTLDASLVAPREVFDLRFAMPRPPFF